MTAMARLSTNLRAHQRTHADAPSPGDQPANERLRPERFAW